MRGFQERSVEENEKKKGWHQREGLAGDEERERHQNGEPRVSYEES